MRGFLKGITLDGKSSRSVKNESLQIRVAKFAKFAKFLHLSSELGDKSGVMRAFQNGITLGGRTSK